MPFTIKRSSRSSVNFINIIRTNNMSEEICEKIIVTLKSENIFRSREGKYCGFNEEFILNEEHECNLDFILTNDEYSNNENQVEYDENNENHVKLYKVNYVIESSGDSDYFVDIFFIPDIDLIFVNGSKNKGNSVLEILSKTLKKFKEDYKNDFDYTEINFNPEFIFWLIFKKNTESSFSNEMTIKKFYNYSTEDFPNEEGQLTPSNIPREISTADGNNIITLPIIYGLLNDRDFSRLSGIFSYKNNEFDIRLTILPGISRKSIFFIKSTKCLKNKNYCDKIKLTLPFISEFVKIFEEWNSLDDIEKYPSEEFINELKINLIKEFNFTLNEYYNYKKDFNEKTKRDPEKIGKIISIDPKIDLSKADDKINECVEYLVSKNVLLYL